MYKYLWLSQPLSISNCTVVRTIHCVPLMLSQNKATRLVLNCHYSEINILA